MAEGVVRPLILAALFVGSLAGNAGATAQSSELLREGMKNLRAQDFAAAESAFARAIAVDPADGRAAFLRGFALNRLNRHAAALASLEYAALNGVDDPVLDYERGWAAAAVGDWQKAVESLERFEAARPGNGKASEFLGRAYLGLGDLDRAEAKLNEATARDPALAPTVLLAQAQIQARRGELAQASATLSRLLREVPEPAIGDTAREAIQQLTREGQRRKPWNAYLGFGIGRDSNVIALSERIVRPDGITDEESEFVRFNFGADYTARLGPATAVTFAYDGQYDRYTDVSNQNVFDNRIYAHLRHAIVKEVAVSFTATGQKAYLAGDPHFDAYGFRPALQIQPLSWLALEGYWNYTDSDYPEPNATPDILDRDSIARTYGITVYASLPRDLAVIEFGAARIKNNASGSDFDFDAKRYHIGATAPLPLQMTAEARIFWTDYRYDNPNSLAPTTPPGPVGFAFARDDQVRNVSLRLGRPFGENLLGYVQYRKTDSDSNLPVFEYTRWSAFVGIIYRI